MALRRVCSNMDVVAAARQRIKNVFANGVPVYMAFSAGKDSIVLADLTYQLIRAGEINPALLTVFFIDEEAIFDCVEATAKEWRQKFLLAGAAFQWWCIEVRHYNCFNELANDESFICWDRYKQDVWVRHPPAFAIREHSQLRPRMESYQEFLPKVTKDGIVITGVRAAESVQRLQYMAKLNMGIKGITNSNTIYPIYDWKNADIWLYLKHRQLAIPDVYLKMYQVGVNKNSLRVSQFFSIDTARSLVQLNEYYPDLMERIIRRELNAYLAALYWDTEMFGRSTAARRKNAEKQTDKDYKALLVKMFANMPQYFNTPHKMSVAKNYRNLFIKTALFATPADHRKMYEALLGGDPKKRSYRALGQTIYGHFYNDVKTERKEKKRCE